METYLVEDSLDLHSEVGCWSTLCPSNTKWERNQEMQTDGEPRTVSEVNF